MTCYLFFLILYIKFIYKIFPHKKKSRESYDPTASTHQIVPCLATIVIPLAGTPGDTSTCAAETGSKIHLDSGEMTKTYTSKHLFEELSFPQTSPEEKAFMVSFSHLLTGLEDFGCLGKEKELQEDVWIKSSDPWQMLVIFGRIIFCGILQCVCVCVTQINSRSILKKMHCLENRKTRNPILRKRKLLLTVSSWQSMLTIYIFWLVPIKFNLISYVYIYIYIYNIDWFKKKRAFSAPQSLLIISFVSFRVIFPLPWLWEER